MTSIAVVVQAPKRPPQLDQQRLQTLVRGPLTINQAISGEIVVSSQRDQIEAVAAGNKLNVKDMSGKIERIGDNQVPAVLKCLLEGFATPVSAYGINFQLTVLRAEPTKWLQDHILSTEIAQKTKKPVTAASVTLTLQSPPKTWNITLKVDKQGIAVDFNAHQEASELPDENELKQQMGRQYVELTDFLNQLGL